MVGLALSMTFGGVVILHLPQLPDLGMLSMLVPATIFGCTSPRLRVLSGFTLGLWLTAATATREMDLRIPTGTQAEMVVIGMVTGLPSFTDKVHRFQFRVMEGDLAGRRLRLSWRAPEFGLVPGQWWRLTVRIKAPSGSFNFGIFDYERWLFLKRIHGTGYVLVSPAPELIDDDAALVDRVRYKIRERLRSVAQKSSIGTFLALSLGDTSQLERGHWDILNRTGTTHLLIVSGLHIGLIASICFLVFRFLGLGIFRVIFLTAVFTAAYALLAGWGLPVQRAFVMTLVFLACRYFSRHVVLPFQLAVACVCVVVLDPLATLGNGFWLSFGAVCALLLALSGRVDHKKGLARCGIFFSSRSVGRLSVSFAGTRVYEFSAAVGVDVRQPGCDSCCWHVACTPIAGVTTGVSCFPTVGAESVGTVQSPGDHAMGFPGDSGRVRSGGWSTAIRADQLPCFSCGNRHSASTSWPDTAMAWTLALSDHFDTRQGAQ